MKIPAPPRATLFTLALFAATFALAAPAPAVHEHSASEAAQSSDVAERPIEAGAIRLNDAKSSSDDLAGSVWSKSGSMSFQSISTTHGKSTVRGAKPDLVEATLVVNGMQIKHVFDSLQNNVTISTTESVKLEKADVEVLRTFQQEFGKAVLSADTFMSMPRATEVIYRLSEMYSEAPYGIDLPKMRVIDFNIDPEQNADIDPGQNAVAGGLVFGSTEKACGQAGGGFIDLHDTANVCDRGAFYRNAHHDFCPNHDYISNNQKYGCGSSDCYGRCGGGCGALNGQGAWQKDCLDHDVCNRSHNSQFGGCGDEWNEAADDYLNGAIHCIFDHC